ncbi:S9 family peptidase [Tenacibaculum amylolyticum]|uniref:S9 family peptidase n=1 Tax=Tenacibaculum amylolyticum TaxID=104269 RepID=UPI003895B6FD
MKKLKKIAFILFLLASFTTTAQSKKGLAGYPIKEYLGQINISEISMAPNGNYLAIVTMQNNFEKDKEIYTLWKYTLDKTGNPIKKTKFSSGTKNKYNLKWTSDSEFLFYISSNEEGRNLFKKNINGGVAIPMIKDQEIANKMEAYELFRNDTILLNANVCTNKNDDNPLYKDVIYWSEENTCISNFYRLNYKSKKLDSVFTIKQPINYFQISPNQKKLAFVSSDLNTFMKFKEEKRFHTYVFDIKSKSIDKQLTFDGGYEYPKWISNTKLVFNNYGDTNLKAYNYRQGKLFNYNLETSKYTPVDNNFKGAVKDFQILKDNQVVFTATVSTNLNVYKTDKGKIEQVTQFNGKVLGFTFSKSHNLYAFAVVTNKSFPEIYVSKGLGRKLFKISEFNKKLDNFPKPKVEKFSWKNRDNEIVEGVLIWPPNATQKDKLPLVVDIHGGPWSARYEALTLDGLQYYYYGSLLASKGFLVLQPNYTGGIGRGNEFVTNILESPIKKPAFDIISGVESLIDKGWADKNNMVVMGASYGGVLTNSIISETNMFKLALSSCGNWNEVTDYGISDGDILQKYLFKDKKIWKDYEYYLKESPVTKVENITTPTLITHGEKDIRVPTAHSKSMYWALKEIGKTEVELVLFPNEGHLYRKPKNKLKKMMIELEWIDKYINY